MKVLDGPVFLSIHSRSKDRHRIIEIVPSQSIALKKWGPFSRISPIFRIVEFGKESPQEYSFNGKKQLFFIGPVHPERIIAQLSESSKAWLSLGLFNILVIPHTLKEAKNLEKWLEKEKNDPCAFEIWTIQNGVVLDQTIQAARKTPANLPTAVIGIGDGKYPSELGEAIAEYVPLMASTLTRSSSSSAKMCNELSDELIELCGFHEKMLAVSKKDINMPYRALDLMLTINAGLSRLASQTFAGTSPIFERECHFWSHSLLGIGVATLALRNIKIFLEKTLGQARIPQRFWAMSKKKENAIDLSLEMPPDKDFLADVDLGETANEPVCPLISYFSGRDGWRGTTTTISAPLAAITACNSLRWSLLTLTHEFSHIVIGAILSDLSPDFSDPQDLSKFERLWKQNKAGDTLFEEIQRTLLFSILEMEQVATGETPDIRNDHNNESLKALFQKWKPQIEETMVHVFDFIYFYGKDVDKYINGIWSSWGTIPNVTSRIEDYIIRSICAVLSTQWRRGLKAEDLAKKDVEVCLENLNSTDFGGRYVIDALNIIREHWDDRIKKKVRARRQLVKIVSTYLFSKEIATIVRGEPEISGGTKDTEGYTLHPCYIEDKRIRNPLVFTEIYTKLAKPSPAFSLWMYYTLAFCVRRDE